MWSGQRGHAAAKAGDPAPRTPHQNDLRPMNVSGQPSGQGVVKAVVNPATQWGSGLVKAVNPLSQPLRTREIEKRECGCALTTVTTVTEEAHRDREAPRPGVPRERSHRACSGACSVATWHRGSMLAHGRRHRAGAPVRRGAPRPRGRARDLEPRTRDSQEQPVRGRPTWCGHHQRARRSTAPIGAPRISRGPRPVVKPSFFGYRRYPRLRLQEQNPPLNWRKS